MFSIETSRVRGMWPLRQSRIAARICSGAILPVVAGQPAHHEPAEDGRPALLVDEDVRVLLGEHLVAGTREDPQRDLVRHRRRREEDRLLLAEERGAAPLELENRRILALLLVADGGVRDRLAHRRGSAA